MVCEFTWGDHKGIFKENSENSAKTFIFQMLLIEKTVKGFFFFNKELNTALNLMGSFSVL